MKSGIEILSLQLTIAWREKISDAAYLRFYSSRFFYSAIGILIVR